MRTILKSLSGKHKQFLLHNNTQTRECSNIGKKPTINFTARKVSGWKAELSLFHLIDAWPKYLFICKRSWDLVTEWQKPCLAITCFIICGHCCSHQNVSGSCLTSMECLSEAKKYSHTPQRLFSCFWIKKEGSKYQQSLSQMLAIHWGLKKQNSCQKG